MRRALRVGAWVAVLLVSGSTGRAELTLAAPAEAESSHAVRWIEVRGKAGGRAGDRHDIVLALDLSESTLTSSQYDLDGDGPGGRTHPATLRRITDRIPETLRAGWVSRLSTIELEDSVLMAEIAAAEHLIERLALGSIRVSIVAFATVAEVIEEPTTDRLRLRRALVDLRTSFPLKLGGTNFAAAIAQSVGLLTTHNRVERLAPIASIIFLSDGKPTWPPPPPVAMRRAIVEARIAAEKGIRIYPFALGEEALRNLDVYAEMAKMTGGALERLSTPGEVVTGLRAIDLAGLAAIRIRNATTASEAVAVRRFPDGSFDGFVELAPGENRVQVVATLTDGESFEVERVVHYEGEPSPGELAEMLERLRVRTIEIELWAEMKRSRYRKRVHIEAERAR